MIHVAVYKSSIPPMNPETTTWVDLQKAGSLNKSVSDCINEYGYLRQENILYPWLDRENYFIDYVSQLTEIPEEAAKRNKALLLGLGTSLVTPFGQIEQMVTPESKGERKGQETIFTTPKQLREEIGRAHV